MSFRLIVAVALLSVAATAHAGLVAAIPESATVTLIFVALAAIGLAASHRRRKPIDADQAGH